MIGIKDGDNTISIGDGNSHAVFRQKGADLSDVDDMELGETRTIELTRELIEKFTRKFQEVKQKEIKASKDQESRMDRLVERLNRNVITNSSSPAQTANQRCINARDYAGCMSVASTASSNNRIADELKRIRRQQSAALWWKQMTSGQMY